MSKHGMVGEQVETVLKRQAARQVSYDNTKRQPFRGEGNGKFAGLKGGASGGTMGKGGKR